MPIRILPGRSKFPAGVSSCLALLEHGKDADCPEKVASLQEVTRGCRTIQLLLGVRARLDLPGSDCGTSV